MAGTFITDDFNGMLRDCKNKHFLAFLHVWQLHFLFLLFFTFPEKHHLLIQKVCTCSLEAWDCARPWECKKRYDGYSQRDLVSLQHLLKIFNSLIDSLIIQTIFHLRCTMISTYNSAANKTDTLPEPLGCWSLGANADSEHITLSAKSLKKENPNINHW